VPRHLETIQACQNNWQHNEDFSYNQQPPVYFQLVSNSSNKENHHKLSLPTISAQQVEPNFSKEAKQTTGQQKVDAISATEDSSVLNFSSYDFFNYCHADFAMCQPSAEFDNLYHVNNETPLLLE
jgi:hypothetical protein